MEEGKGAEKGERTGKKRKRERAGRGMKVGKGEMGKENIKEK